VAGRSVKTCQLRPQSPTRAKEAKGSFVDLERKQTAKGMIMVEENSMMELNDRAAVIGDKV
jgi:hypothetical protein